MDVLTKIIDTKRKRLEYCKSAVALGNLKKIVRDMDRSRDFKAAIKRGSEQIKLIAEIKKASPSGGLIRADFDPAVIAAIYDKKPVDAVSVLTEEDFFQGHLSYIEKVRGATCKPILRKDFIFDEYQIYETRASHADAMLLIAAALEKNQADEYLHLAKEIGLHVLFEVHNDDDVEKAMQINADIIGINNRNLKSLEVDISTTLRLRKHLPDNITIVSESGIKEREDVVRLSNAGIDAMLIGTSLMKNKDIGEKIDELMGQHKK